MFEDISTQQDTHSYAAVRNGQTVSRDWPQVLDSRLSATAVALHRCQKFNYFDSHWSTREDGERLVSKAKQQVRD